MSYVPPSLYDFEKQILTEIKRRNSDPIQLTNVTTKNDITNYDFVKKILNGEEIYSKFVSKSRKEKSQQSLFDAIPELNTHLVSNTAEIKSCQSQKAKFNQKLNFIRKNIRDNRELGFKILTNIQKKHIALCNYAIDYFEEEIKRLEIDRLHIIGFTSYLSKCNYESFVNTKQFFLERIQLGADPKNLDYCYSIISYKDYGFGNLDWKCNFLNKNTKSGRIVNRMLDKIKSLDYDDFLSIVDAIAPECPNYEELRTFLFDLAWSKFPFPFSLVTPYHMPEIFGQSPKVFSPRHLSQPWIDMPFVELCESSWPYKKASDSLLDLMLETSPFAMVSDFFRTVQLTTEAAANECGKDPGEIDFDELFSLLLVEVFATCQRGLMQPMAYAISFADFMDGPHMSLAAAHLQALYVHILNIGNVQEAMCSGCN